MRRLKDHLFYLLLMLQICAYDTATINRSDKHLTAQSVVQDYLKIFEAQPGTNAPSWHPKRGSARTPRRGSDSSQETLQEETPQESKNGVKLQAEERQDEVEGESPSEGRWTRQRGELHDQYRASSPVVHSTPPESHSSPASSLDTSQQQVSQAGGREYEWIPSEEALAPAAELSALSVPINYEPEAHPPGTQLLELSPSRKIALNAKTAMEYPWVKLLDEEVRTAFEAEIVRATAAHQAELAAFRQRQREAGAPAVLCLEECADEYWRGGGEGPASPSSSSSSEKEGPRACWSSCCFQCDYAFDLLTGVRFQDRPFAVDAGSSGAEIYRTRALDGRKLFAKLACVPGGMTSYEATKPRTHNENEELRCNMRLRDNKMGASPIAFDRSRQMVSMAVVKLAQQCGLGALHVATWVETLSGAMPAVGVPIRHQEALIAEDAPGVSLTLLVNDHKGGDPQMVKEVLDGVNKTQVVQVALHDLLFSELDRHAGNVIVDEHGALRLIDNDQALGITYGHRLWSNIRGVDSCFIPITARGQECAENKHLRTLDYRCHVEDGAIGTNYPPQFKQCLEEFVHTSPEDLRRKYLMPRQDQAELLRIRAMHMLQLGFEDAQSTALEEERHKYETGNSRATWRPASALNCEYGDV